jgi:hypothetical protein
VQEDPDDVEPFPGLDLLPDQDSFRVEFAELERAADLVVVRDDETIEATLGGDGQEITRAAEAVE